MNSFSHESMRNDSQMADDTLDLTNRILDKIDQEMSQLHGQPDLGYTGAKNCGVKSWKSNDLETIDSVSYVEDCLSTEKDAATFNDTVLSSIVDTDRFPQKNRGKRPKSALGRLNNLDKSLEAEELLKSLIEKRFPVHESPDSSPIFEVPRMKLNDYIHRGRADQRVDLGDMIRRRINADSEVESVVSRNLNPRTNIMQNFRLSAQQSGIQQHFTNSQNSAFMPNWASPIHPEKSSKLTSKRGLAPHQRSNRGTKNGLSKPQSSSYWNSGDGAMSSSQSTASFSMVFKEPPSLLSYMPNKTKVDRWKSYDSLSSHSIKLDSPMASRSRLVSKTPKQTSYRSSSQPANVSKYSKKSNRGTSRFSEFVPKSYESSEIGSATEQEIDYIKAEAARIKHELEMNKNKHSCRGRNFTRVERQPSSGTLTPSTPRSVTNQPIGNYSSKSSSDVILKETERSMAKLKDLDLEVQAVLSKKQNASKDLTDLQEKKAKLEDEIMENESKVRSQKLASRNEQHELDALREQKAQTESELNELKSELEQAKSSWNNQLEMNTRQVAKLIEENALLKESLQRGEITQYERYELQRQLEELREQMRTDNAEHRFKTHELSSELSEAEKRLRQYDETNRELIFRLEQLDGNYAEKVKKVTEIHSLVKGELNETSDALNHLNEEHETLKQNSQEQQEKIGDLEQLLKGKEDENAELMRLNEQLQVEMHRLEQRQTDGMRDLEAALTKEKASAVDELHAKIDELNKKHHSSLAELRHDMESLRKEKGKEIEFWKEKLAQQEEATRDLGERLRLEAQEQVRVAVAQERANFETERTQLMRRERENFDDEMARSTRRFQEAIDYEKKQLKQSHDHCADLKSEMEALRAENRNLYKEATDANLVARENTLREHTNELNSLRERLVSEHNEKVFQLEDQIRSLQDQLDLVKVEHENASSRYADLENRVVQHEKAILLEVNEECRRICKMLNINFNRIKKKRAVAQVEIEGGTETSGNRAGAAINGTTQALINLKACVSELQTFVYELKEALDTEKLKSQQMKERQEISLRTLRDELNIETERKMDDLKDKLHHAHMKEMTKMQEAMIDQDLHTDLIDLKKENAQLKSDMSKFKRETADKLAKQFEKEVETMVEKRLKSDSYIPRRHYMELERDHKRLLNQLEPSRVEKPTLEPVEGSASLQLLKHLQHKVNALKDENSKLKLNMSLNPVNDVPPRAAPCT